MGVEEVDVFIDMVITYENVLQKFKVDVMDGEVAKI